MPTYFSVKSEQGLELRRGGYGEVQDAVLGTMKVPIKPLLLKFRELTQPFPVYGLPGKGGLARGILTPKEGARQIRARSAELGGAADNLPESDVDLALWVIQKLRSHPMKGALFVEVQDSADVDEEIPEEELKASAPMADPAGVIRVSGHQAYCQVCDKSMDKRGITGHQKSKAHIANLSLRDAELQKASGF